MFHVETVGRAEGQNNAHEKSPHDRTFWRRRVKSPHDRTFAAVVPAGKEQTRSMLHYSANTTAGHYYHARRTLPPRSQDTGHRARRTLPPRSQDAATTLAGQFHVTFSGQMGHERSASVRMSGSDPTA